MCCLVVVPLALSPVQRLLLAAAVELAPPLVVVAVQLVFLALSVPAVVPAQ